METSKPLFGCEYQSEGHRCGSPAEFSVVWKWRTPGGFPKPVASRLESLTGRRTAKDECATCRTHSRQLADDLAALGLLAEIQSMLPLKGGESRSSNELLSDLNFSRALALGRRS